MNAAFDPGSGPRRDPSGWQLVTPARLRAGLSLAELFFRYVALGGAASSILLADYCKTGAPLPDGESDLVVLALNERFMEMDALERLPYGGDGESR